jgi:hypothetical protein
MEELIFFAVIIFFSIIESIARSRKKRAGGSPQIPDEWEPEPAGREWQPPTRDVPTRTTTSYDADLSYDDLEVAEARDPRSGSEGMVPADIWEEIAGLARGRVRQLETRPEPPPPAPAPAPALPARLGWGKRTPKVGQAHRVHLAHQHYGTDPSERPPSALDALDPLARPLSADAKAVREQLRTGGRHALRQAVILQEILGPPSSMRSEGILE